ncbi:unnamed protein product [Mytilus edulis]|uniref:B box-type domain-containing protein n=1 Tax=Mytilus edulis TaxID=6550 RepID=A0A8S3QWL8_MYTED|nr:unnamed protein product [Mytilus edulis]
MASSKPIPCGPCIEGKVNTKADIWCYNCDEGLCSTCSGHHRRSKGTRDHKTIGIKKEEDLPRSRYHLESGKSKATDLITEIEEKQKNLKKMQDQLHTVIPHASKLQSFLGVHQIEQQVHQCQRYIDDLEKDDRAKEFTIKMEKNNEVEKIIKKLGSLGELTVVKTDMDLKKETSVRREAQVESQEQSNINNMTMNIEKKIKINMDKTVSDMICLSDGRLIIL